VITKCRGGGCTLITTCRRYTAAPVTKQTWYSVPPVELDGTCPQYLPQDMGAPITLRIPVKPESAPKEPAVVGSAGPVDPIALLPGGRKIRARKIAAPKPKPVDTAPAVTTVPAVKQPAQPQPSEDDMALLSPTQMKPLKGHKQHPMHKAKSKDGPTHVTAAGTCKYQANGPVSWAMEFRRLAREIGGPGAPVGVGIRAVLAAGLSVAPDKVVKLAHGRTDATGFTPGREDK